MTTPRDLAKALIQQQLSADRELLTARRQEIAASIDGLKAMQQKADAIEEANKGAIVNRLGIDRDSALGTAVNVGASAINTVARAVGNTAALVPSFEAAINQGSADEEDKAAYSRYKSGKATEQDIQRLSRVQAGRSEVQDPMGVILGDQAAGSANGLTVLQALDQAEAARSTAQGIRGATDLTGLVDQRDNIRMADQAQAMVEAEGGKLGDAWSRLTASGNQGAAARLKALGDLASAGGAFAANRAKLIADNPAAVANAAPDAAMSIGLNLLGPAGVALNAAQTIGQAQDAYEKGIQNFRDDKTANPEGNLYGDQKTLNRQALGAVGYAATELLGDAILTSGFKAGAAAVNAVKKPLVKEAAQETAAQVSAEAAKAGFKQTLLQGSKEISKAAGKLYGSAEAEALSETASTVFEGMASNKDATGADLLVANAVGFALGAGAPVTAAAGAVGVQAAKDFGQAKANVAQQREQDKALNAAVDEAVARRDVSTLVDPKSEQYNPAVAIKALGALSAQEGTTPQQAQAWRGQAADVVKSLTDEVASIDAALNPDVAAVEKRLAQVQERIAQAASGTDTTALQSTASGLEQALQAMRNPDPAEVEGLKTKRQTTADRLAEAEAAFEAFSQQASTKLAKDTVANTNVDELVGSIVTPSTAQPAQQSQQVQESAQKLRLFTMASPTALSAAQASQVLKSKDLSAQDRDYFTRYEAVQRVWEQTKAMAQVNQEVLFGDAKTRQKGLTQYRERFARLMMNDLTPAAAKEAQGLVRFMQSHAQKFAAVSLALKQAEQTGQEYSLQRQADGTFSIVELTQSPNYDPKTQTLKRGSKELLIGKGSEQLVESVRAETRAMYALAKFMSGVKDSKGNAALQESEFSSVVQNALQSTAQRWGVSNEARTQTSTQANTQTTQPNPGADAAVDVAAVVDPVDPAADPAAGVDPADSVDAAPDNFDDRNIPLDESEAGQNSAQVDADGQFYFDSGFDEQDAAVDASIAQDAQQAQTQATVPAKPEGIVTALSAEVAAVTEVQGKDAQWNAKLKEQIERLRTWLKQSGGSDQALSKRPLVMVKDFMAGFVSGQYSGAEFLAEGIKPHHEKALAYVKAAAPVWMADVAGLINRANRPQDFAKTPLEFLLSGSGVDAQMDTNVQAAVAVGAMTWVAETLSRGGLANDANTVGSMLGLEAEEVPANAVAQLTYAGTYQNWAAQDIGKRIVQALGFKPTADAPQNFMPTLEVALGGLALELLVKRGLVERVVFDPQAWASLTGGQAGDGDVARTFFRLTRDPDVESAASTKVATLEKAFAGSGNVVQDLFGVQSEYVVPTFEPVAYDQKRLLKAKTLVPSFIAKVLDKKNREPNYLKVGMWSVFNALGEHSDALDAIVGVQDTQGIQETRKRNVEAKNEGLRRDLTNIFDFVNGPWLNKGDGLKSPIYLQHTNWRNQRVGIVNGVFNPQASKIARHLIYRNDWQSTVDPNKADKAHDNFKLRVLESFGVKTDKQSNAKSLALWETKIANDTVKAAVDALKPLVAMQATELSAAQATAVAAAVKAGGENAKTLDALVALAEYEVAKEEGTTFTSTLVGEVDGVTNGPMLNLVLLGAAHSMDAMFNSLNKGGFYRVGQAFSAFNLFKDESKANDLYEDTIGGVVQALAAGAPNRKPWQERQLQAVYAITGDFVDATGAVVKAGRDIIKRPIASLNFGSSTQSAVNGMAEDFVETLFKKIEKASAENKPVKSLITAINTLYGPKNEQFHLNPNMDARSLLEYNFSNTELDALKTAFGWAVGKTTGKVLESRFAGMIGIRDRMVANTNFMYRLYQSTYDSMRGGYLQELVSQSTKGQGILSEGGKRQYDLTAKQEQRLEYLTRRVAPMIHTAASLASKSLAAGMSMVKWESDSELQDYTYQARLNLNKANASQSTMLLRAANKHMTEPGVLAASALIHSFDSYVSHLAANLSEALNIHDAHVTGIEKFEEVARNLNQSLYQAILEYSPAQEVYAAMERQIVGLVGILKDPVFSEDVKAPLMKQLLAEMENDEVADLYGNGADWAGYLLYKLEMAKYQAWTADQMRLGAAAEMAVLDQYALEGGAYTVTEQDRATAKEKMAALSREVSPELVSTLKALQQEMQLRDQAAAAQAKAEQRARLEAKAVEFFGGDKALVNAVLEELSTNEAVPDYIQTTAALMRDGDVEILSAAEMVAVYEYAQMLMGEQLALQTRNTPFGMVRPLNTRNRVEGAVRQILQRSNSALTVASLMSTKADDPALRSLFSLLGKAMDPSTKIEVITPQSDFTKITAPDVPASAWFNRANNTVYVLSAEFDRADISQEMLVHEFTHAVVSSIIDSPKTPNQKKAVAQLNNILSLAQAHIAAHPELASFQYMTSDVHELLSFGLSNKAFQTKVLAKIPMVAERQSTFSNALKSFVQTILELIVGKEHVKAAQGTALADVLAAGVELLHQAQEQQKRDAKAVVEGKPILRTMQVPPGSALSSVPAVVDNIRNFTTDQVFEALPSNGNSSIFRTHLQSAVQSIVGSLHGPFGAIKAQIEARVGKTELDAWAWAAANGMRPFNADVLHAGVKFTAAEAFVAEQIQATMQQVLATKNGAQHPAYRQLSRLYTQARAELKGKIPQDVYDFVFVNLPKSANGSNDYLSRFVAVAMAHEGFNKAMDFHVRKSPLSGQGFAGKSFLQALDQLWQSLVEWLGAVEAKTLGRTEGVEVLDSLVANLVQIEARAKDQVVSERTAAVDFLINSGRAMERANQKASELIIQAKDKLVAAAQSDFVSNNGIALIKTAGIGVELIAGNRVAAALTGLQRLYNEARSGKNNEAMQILNYIKGPGQWLNAVIREAKRIEGERKHIATQAQKLVAQSFKDGMANMSDAQKAAVSQVLLRTGAHYLLSQYNTKDIQRMLESGQDLQAAINKEIALLNGMQAQHFYIRQAKGLGLMKITGKPGQHAQLQNAYAIARVMGEMAAFEESISEDEAKTAQPVIERLIALYGLQYAHLSPHDGRDLTLANPKDYVLEVLRGENARTDGNGIEVALMMHKNLERESAARLFADSPALMMHGYLPEVHTPRVKFEVVRDPAQIAELQSQGYVTQGKVELDVHDPDRRPGVLMSLKGVSLARWQSGGFSTTSTASRGSEKHNQHFSHYTSTGVSNMQSMDSIRAKELRAVSEQFKANPGFDPANNLDKNYLIPLLNARGEVVEYRYMMSEQLRNTMLERDNRFDHLMGVMAGSIYDKQTSKENNRQLVQALSQHYDKTVAKDPKSFVLVGEESEDPELREIWNLLPSATKDDVRQAWGMRGMFVPKEMLTPLFGYRKLSAAQMWDKHPQALNLAQKVFVEIAEGLVTTYARGYLRMDAASAARYAKRTANLVRMVEQGAEEIVREVKDIIVVKTLTVLWNNILSNMTVLWFNGMNPIKALTLQKEAWLAVSEYTRDRNALDQLKLQRDRGIGSASSMASASARSELMAEIARLEDAVNRNPAKELIDAGMLPTIVEDVALDDDRYSYKSGLSQWVDSKTAKLPKAVQTLGRFMYMTHDTPLYQFLSQSTQFSDFVGRYALYKHLTEGVEPGQRKSKEDALFEASEWFVNYDIPMPRSLQYLDDMFILPFTKYTLSMQRKIFQLMRDKPLNVINGIMLNNALGDLMPLVTDSNMLYKLDQIGLKPSAAALPGVLDDLATVEMGAALFK